MRHLPLPLGGMRQLFWFSCINLNFISLYYILNTSVIELVVTELIYLYNGLFCKCFIMLMQLVVTASNCIPSLECSIQLAAAPEQRQINILVQSRMRSSLQQIHDRNVPVIQNIQKSYDAVTKLWVQIILIRVWNCFIYYIQCDWRCDSRNKKIRWIPWRNLQ